MGSGSCVSESAARRRRITGGPLQLRRQSASRVWLGALEEWLRRGRPLIVLRPITVAACDCEPEPERPVAVEGRPGWDPETLRAIAEVLATLEHQP